MTGSSRIAAGTRLLGRLTLPSDTHFEGTLSGELTATGALTIGSSACVEGPIQARDVVVEGTVRGPIVGTEHVELRCGARVEGDIRSACVMLAEGSDLDGRVFISV